jgi:hypothetical protein
LIVACRSVTIPDQFEKQAPAYQLKVTGKELADQLF